MGQVDKIVNAVQEVTGKDKLDADEATDKSYLQAEDPGQEGANVKQATQGPGS